MNRFCARHGMHDMAYQIPQGTWIERKLFYKHILFDDHTKLIFAYLPKVNCSLVRSLAFNLNCYLEVSRHIQHTKHVHQVLSVFGFNCRFRPCIGLEFHRYI